VHVGAAAGLPPIPSREKKKFATLLLIFVKAKLFVSVGS
jgi:hypothetical protein